MQHAVQTSGITSVVPHVWICAGGHGENLRPYRAVRLVTGRTDEFWHVEGIV